MSNVVPIASIVSGSSAVANGIALVTGSTQTYWTMAVTASGAPTAGVVAIQLSHDGVNWFAPASNSVTTSAAGVSAVTVGPIAASYARAAITTAITGGTVAATVAASS